MNRQDILDNLAQHTETGLRPRLLRDYPATARSVIGVPFSYLSSLGREWARRKDWRDIVDSVLSDSTYEEVLLQAFTFGNASTDAKEAFRRIRLHLEKLDSRMLCDASCLAFHAAQTWPEKMLEFLTPYLKADDDFGQRFAIVTLLDYFTTSDYIRDTLKLYASVKPQNAYAVDALQWGYMVCFQAYPYKTAATLRQAGLNGEEMKALVKRIVSSPRTNILSRQLALELCS